MNKDFNQYLSTFTVPLTPRQRIASLINIVSQLTELISVLLEREPRLCTKDVSDVLQEVALNTHKLVLHDDEAET